MSLRYDPIWRHMDTFGKASVPYAPFCKLNPAEHGSLCRLPVEAFL
jgi:hypothetical protein